jgi:hypothetical protein
MSAAGPEVRTPPDTASPRDGRDYRGTDVGGEVARKILA